MTKDKQIEKYRKEMKRWKDKYLQLRREFLCCHEWETLQTVYYKERCGGGRGRIETIHRCIKCDKIKKTEGRVYGIKDYFI